MFAIAHPRLEQMIKLKMADQEKSNVYVVFTMMFAALNFVTGKL